MRQTYTPAELIVVDDGRPSVESLVSGRDHVRYIRLNRRTSTGEKLNAGIRAARGEIIQKLDDDDYYHPDFLRTAVASLPRRPSERTVVAWCCFLTMFPGDRRLYHSGHGLRAGGTLCFYRKLWERIPFRDMTLGQDTRFFEDHQPRIVRVCAPEYYMVVRHGRNTWTRHVQGWTADEYLRAGPISRRRIDQVVVDKADLRFYQQLKWNGV